ncbi:beta-L-arabinofuranosidase domain-containing protein [Opitutus sp. ER46]|uniref:glycoside hydrolase family 127 protein n=1 Tax=Opitutus sp. ER46 TaxID=2161864 RepID=UPI000D31FAE1|nr:beta-L-arabinofuranosidase domain-containing protein [Opitutus sp. ER46]PTX99086.1 ATP-binding protein [Opitutus sp. ER46]
MKLPFALGLSFLTALVPLTLRGGERSLIDTTRSPAAKMYMVDLADVKWTSGFWAERFAACQHTMVPHLWEIFQSDTDSHAWANFLIAGGVESRGDNKFHGPPFNDGDFLKWFEALAQVYAVTRDPAIDAQMDRIIAVVAKAQREDGYLHTQTVIPQRQGDPKVKEFADREHFETYNMGHLMTAACVHYRVTGKTTMLDLARKAADYIDGLCTRVPEELARNAICPSHYMGVIELYRVTREPRYLELGRKLIEIRSLVPAEVGSDYNQDRLPFRELTTAAGHAVRANYLYAGVADVFAESGDATLLRTLGVLADNVAGTKLYITGMTGALYDGASPDGAKDHKSIQPTHQSYGRDYQLPNLTAYNETCATIGYAMWNWRMLTLSGDARYADLFEQSLYNGVLPGISLEGKDYFYVNPLRKSADFQWPMRWSRSRMPNIKSSFCCPPNVVRTIAEAHNYVYSLSADTLWVHLYAASTLDTAWTDGARIRLRQDTNYPWDGAIKFTIDEAPARPIKVRLRIPGWSKPDRAVVTVNGDALADGLGGRPVPGTYFDVTRTWKAGDTLELKIAFAPTVWEANPLVEETRNQVAVRYGPLVYCLEQNDLPEGVKLDDVSLGRWLKAGECRTVPLQIVNANVLALKLPGWTQEAPAWAAGELYREATLGRVRRTELTFVPYFAWGNRGDTDMSVWIPAR